MPQPATTRMKMGSRKQQLLTNSSAGGGGGDFNIALLGAQAVGKSGRQTGHDWPRLATTGHDWPRLATTDRRNGTEWPVYAQLYCTNKIISVRRMHGVRFRSCAHSDISTVSSFCLRMCLCRSASFHAPPFHIAATTWSAYDLYTHIAPRQYKMATHRKWRRIEGGWMDDTHV